MLFVCCIVYQCVAVCWSVCLCMLKANEGGNAR